MDKKPFIRDERTIAVADRSCRLTSIVVLFGVLIDAVVRGLLLEEACWDLLGLAFLGSAIATFYQVRHRIIAPRWFRLAMLLLLVGVVAGGLSAMMSLLMR